MSYVFSRAPIGVVFDVSGPTKKLEQDTAEDAKDGDRESHPVDPSEH